MHVEPAAQVVGPDHPMPPHCPYLGAVPELVPVPDEADELLVEVDVPVPVDVELEGNEPALEVYVGTVEGPVGVSPLRTQPDFAVSAAGHVTSVKVTPGLSESPNQSNRQ